MSEMITCDVVVVGAGIAGASAAWALAADRDVVLLEADEAPGRHSTGRSAALFAETYGPPLVRALTRASRAFFESPPPDFAEVPLVTPRGVLHVARADQAAPLAQAAAAAGVAPVDGAEARRLCPLLAEGYAAGAVFEPDARDIDVHALHQGYLRGFKARGGRLVTAAPVTALDRIAGHWRVVTPTLRFAAPVLVDAGGAWGDELAGLADLAPLGLVPKRRTIVLLEAPAERFAPDLPMVVDVDEAFYFKPESGRLLASPADATPCPPCDAQPEELDIAVAVDRVERATGLTFRRVVSKWAGLRTFAPDGLPVCGWGAEGFLWLVGQGGYGIQTAPALAELAASLVRGEAAPAAFAALGPERLR